MADRTPPVALAERVAEAARDLGIETALIGAGALAVHGYVRGTADLDLASAVDPYVELGRLEEALRSLGLHVKRNLPDEEDRLGGLVRVWNEEDDDGDPIDPVELVNFFNPLRPRPNPARDAIAGAARISEDTPLRCVRLPDLIALKLYAGGRSDLADVVEVLKRNPDADDEAVRTTCKRYGFDVIDELLAEARA